MKMWLVLFLAMSIALVACPRNGSAEVQSFADEVDWIQTLVDRGEALDNEKSPEIYAEAMQLAEALIEAYPDSARSHYSLAIAAGNLALYKGGKDKVRLAKVIKDSLDESLRIDPEMADAYRVRGVYFYELATLSRILKLFAKVLYGGLPAGSLEDAASDLTTAMTLDPKSIYAHYNLAKTRYAQKNYGAAKELCNMIPNLTDTDDQDPQTRLDAAELARKAAKEIAKRANRRG